MSGAAPAEGEDARGPGDDQGEPQAEGGEEGEVEDDAQNGAGTEDGAAPGANPLLGGPALVGAAEWIADPESVEDLLAQAETEADRRLMGVYGDTVHRNDGRHLRGGVDPATNDRHIDWFDRVVGHSHKLYFPPRNAVGKRFVRLLAELWRGVLERRWNSELPLIFPACILRVARGTVETRKIKQRISQRLDLWEDGKVEALVSQVESAALWEGRLSRRQQDEESEARRFNSLVLAGRLRSAVRNLTAREGGGVRAAGDVCTKTGENIVAVLEAKFPPLREANIGSEDCLAFEEYPRAPDPLDLIVGGDDVEKVAGKLSGAAGIDCVDAADAQGYLVAHEGASALLRGVMADLTE